MKDTGGPAFPFWCDSNGMANFQGMTLRDYFAAKAMQGPEPLAGMSEMNRTIAYCAASKLRELGYEWDGKTWAALAQQDEPKGGDGMTSQTAYVVMLNDSPEHVVIGDKDLAQMRMHELRERYWVRHQGTLESRKKYALRCHWYIREVDGEVAA